MKKVSIAFIAIISISCSSQKKLAQEDKWIQLFNGKDLNNWTIKIKDHPVNENFGNTFRVENGLMEVRYDQYDEFKEQYGHIFTKQKFSAYLLVVEYRFVGEQVKGGPGWAIRNNGMMLHGQTPESMAVEQDFPISLEEQLLGGDGKTERSTGNLCSPGTNVILDGKLFTPHCINSSSKTYHGDQWVRAEALVLRDSVIKHIINGDTVLTYTQPQYDGNDPWVKRAGLKGGATISEGTISLQGESHPADFRKVELFNLEPYMNNPQKLQEVLNTLKHRKQGELN